MPPQTVGCEDYEVILTFLPNGRQGTKLAGSLHLAPRLKCDGRLEQYANSFADWPRTFQRMKWRLCFKAGSVKTNDEDTARTVSIDLVSPSVVDSQLWRAIFPPTTVIEGYKLDARGYLENGAPTVITPPSSDLKRNVLDPLYKEYIRNTKGGLAVRSTIKSRLQELGLMTPRSAEIKAAPVQAIPNQLVSATTRSRQYEITRALKEFSLSSKGVQEPASQERLRLREFFSSRKPSLVRPDLVKKLTPLQGIRANMFLRYQIFSQAQKSDQPVEPPKQETTELVERATEFHSLVATVGDYPELMRRLGLIWDFLIDDPGFPDEGWGWIEPVDDGARLSHWICPRVAFDKRTFMTRPDDTEDPEIQSGLLLLGQPLLLKEGNTSKPARDPVTNNVVLKFDVVPGDILGTAGKLDRFLQEGGDEVADSSLLSLPTRRAAGLAIVHRERDAWLRELLFRRKRLQDKLTSEQVSQGVRGKTLELKAEDLIRGFRIDVREIRRESSGVVVGPWRPLCGRKGEYDFAHVPTLRIDHSDEGWISLAVTEGSQLKDDEGKDLGGALLLHEELFRWAGWGLCVPKPGKLPQEPKQSDLNASVKTPFKVTFSAISGTLPKLRFGRQYQFRARVVDLAGNSRPFKTEETSESQYLTDASDGHYDRFDPVGSPILLFTKEVTVVNQVSAEGRMPISETIDCLVIRTFNGGSGSVPLSGSSQRDERHVVPPKTHLGMVEAHGMLDDESGGLQADHAYRVLIEKERQDATMPIRDGGILTKGSFVVPYLADPMANGVSYQYLIPGSNPVSVEHPITQHEYAGSWPDQQSLILRLQAGSAAPQVEKNVCTFFLPPGEQATLRLSSSLAPHSEQLFDVWRTLNEIANGEEREHRLHELVQGRNVMVTPYRQVRLIHATEEPVMTPHWETFLVDRKILETPISLYAKVRLHRQSTDSIALRAEWIECIDEGVMTEKKEDWLYRKRGIPVTQTHINLVGADDHSNSQVPTDAKPTQPQPADLVPDGSELSAQRFADVESSKTVVAVQEIAKQCKLEQPSTAPKQDQSRGNGEIVALSFGVHKFGDTKFRSVTYMGSAISRYQEFFGPSKQKASVSDFSKTMQPIMKVVPNSSPPPPPRVLYVMPTFEWTSSNNKTGRRGGGLRIYLDRGWCASGDGEQLAVLLGPNNSDDFNEDLQSIYTMWGQDPLWINGDRSSEEIYSPGWRQPTPDQFSDPIHIRKDLSVELSINGKVGPQPVTICTFNVHPDATRQLWYCDLTLNPGAAYFPFVRLALARYQHCSLESAHLSRPILADFAQVVPDRSITITRGRKEGEYSVMVVGPSPSVKPQARTIKMEAHLEQRFSARSDELGWISADVNPVSLLDRTTSDEGWVGSITVFRRPQQEYRVVIKEFEEFLLPGQSKIDPSQRRLVYAQTIALR